MCLLKRVSQITALALVLGAAAPSAAFADWFLGAGIGASTGGSLATSQRTYTGQFGVVSRVGWFGFEGDYGMITGSGTGSDARTLSGAILVGHRARGIRPYGAVGFGVLGSVGSFSDEFRVTGDTVISNEMLSYGGGVMVDVARHLGVRGDIRVFRDMQSIDAGAVRLTFTRLAASVYVRF